jgi:ADP-heptose:LPS heptosyltransferase
MSFQTDSSSELTYPAPLPPMVGKYLVRKRYVAAGLRAIDFASMAFTSAGPRLASAGLGSASSPQLHSILFSQCGHLGDLIMTLPALRWIRQNRPEMKIGLVVGTWAKPMMAGISELYDFCYFADHFMLDRSTRPFKEKLTRHRQSWKLTAAQVRRDGYDAAIECFPFLQNSIPLLYASNIPVRAGFTSGGFGPLLTHKARWTHASRPFLDYPRDLLRLLFSDRSLDSQFQAYYPLPPTTVKRPKQPYIILQMGAGNPIREWSEERWTLVARELTSRGLSLVMAGAGPREQQTAARISEALAPQAILNLCDKLSWDEFVDLVAGAAHVVCLESSTSHIAAAFKISSTVIMPSTNDPKQFGPANEKASILTFKTPCAPCFRSRGCEHMACIQRVSADDVTRSVLESLGVATLLPV